HISDVKNCLSPGGEFDLSKSKSISLKKSEMEEMVGLSKMVDHYHKIFWEEKVAESIYIFATKSCPNTFLLNTRKIRIMF
ncbi:MAG: hypothetical protein N0E48_11395, partial [Candidatus Thiodiazotropha endolucinida]|nr:hypothetical protein [Candidatus Thiodiazotropha taylori]MCW4343946.1 hypothetical protein [Candidatus Thiodiazotropha endolucinida]